MCLKCVKLHLRRPFFQKFSWGGMPQTPLVPHALRVLAIHPLASFKFWLPTSKSLDNTEFDWPSCLTPATSNMESTISSSWPNYQLQLSWLNANCFIIMIWMEILNEIPGIRRSPHSKIAFTLSTFVPWNATCHLLNTSSAKARWWTLQIHIEYIKRELLQSPVIQMLVSVVSYYT